MLPKPKSCQGCPFYGDGKGFVPDLVNDQAEVFIYAQNPGESEENGVCWTGVSYEPHKIEPLIGKTGYQMDKFYLPLAGLTRGATSLGNSLRCRYRHKNELPPIDRVATRQALEHCHRAHFKMPAKTRVIVAQGEYAMYALTQYGAEKYHKVSDWRGYVLPFEPVGTSRTVHTDIWVPSRSRVPATCPVLVTYHLAYLSRDATAGLICKSDWSKVPKLLNGTWPEILPPINYGPPPVWPPVSAFDTEYDPTNYHFLCYSLYDGKKLRVSEELSPGIVAIVEKGGQPSLPHVVMHNSPADLPFLEKMLPRFTYDDTMYQHSVLWSDFDHDLGFLGSIYGPINRWKHLDRINPKVYSAADAYVTWGAWEKLSEELDRDLLSKKIYHNSQLRLIPIIRKAEATGILINPDKARMRYEQRRKIMDDLTLKAEAVVGWPINLRSNDQVANQIYNIEGLLDLVRGKK